MCYLNGLLLPTPSERILITSLIRSLKLQRPQHPDFRVKKPFVFFTPTISPYFFLISSALPFRAVGTESDKRFVEVSSPIADFAGRGGSSACFARQRRSRSRQNVSQSCSKRCPHVLQQLTTLRRLLQNTIRFCMAPKQKHV